MFCADVSSHAAAPSAHGAASHQASDWQPCDLSCSIAYVSRYKSDCADTGPEHEDQRYSRRLNKLAARPFWRPSTTRLSISDAIARGNRFCLYATVNQRSKNAC